MNLRWTRYSAGLVNDNPALGVRDERIPGAFFFDGEEGFVGFGGAGAVEAFTRAALVIVDGGENVVAGDIIEKDGSSFPRGGSGKCRIPRTPP